MKKKFVAILLTVTLSTALVACSGDSTADTKPKTETSVSEKDTKDTAKREDKKEVDKKKADTDKKKAETGKKKEEDKKKESEKKAEKTDNKETTKTASADKDSTAETANQSDNSSSADNSSNTGNSGNAGNSNSGSVNKPNTGSGNNGNHNGNNKPDNGNNGNHNGGSNNNGNGNNGGGNNKPAPHEHSYQVVSSTNGDCSHAGTVTKKCSCGDTVTENGSYGDHNWQDQYKDVYHDAVYEEQPVYEWVAYHQCNKCGAQFDNLEDMGIHCIDCNSGYSTKKKQVQTGYTNVKIQDAYTERVPNGKKCTICNTHQ